LDFNRIFLQNILPPKRNASIFQITKSRYIEQDFEISLENKDSLHRNSKVSLHYSLIRHFITYKYKIRVRCSLFIIFSNKLCAREIVSIDEYSFY